MGTLLSQLYLGIPSSFPMPITPLTPSPTFPPFPFPPLPPPPPHKKQQESIAKRIVRVIFFCRGRGGGGGEGNKGGKYLRENYLFFFVYFRWPRSVRANGHLLLNSEKVFSFLEP